MDSGLYAAYTGVLARTQALDSAANNLANANTNGFRAQREFFRGVMAAAQEETGGNGMQTAVNSFGLLGGSTLDLSQGLLQATGNPLDLGLQGQGFFQVKTDHGIRLTRDGSFQRSADGTLTTGHGEPVLNAAGGTITVPTGNVNVGADGTISVTTPDGNAIAGKVGIVDYAAADLSSEGTNRFAIRDGAKALATATATVQEGSLEGANQDAVHGTMQLLLVQRQAEMMQKALSVFSNDLDKTATEELGRV